MKEAFRGVYAIPPTPFTDDDRVDEPSLRRTVDFCLEAGAHGIVATVNASEGPFLSDEERALVIRVVVEEVRGRVPVIAGVSGPSTGISVAYALRAEESGADALIAMPPYVKHPSAEEIPAFYQALAAATTLPIWVQNCVAPVGTPMSAALVARLVREIEKVGWLKEETAFAPQLMSQAKELAGDALKGFMGGMAGRFLFDEVARGACGTMPACEVIDAHVAVWNALEAGDEALARRHFRLLLPLLSYESMFSVVVYKEVLLRRGLIRSARVRTPGSPALDRQSHRELGRILDDIAPLLAARIPAGT